MIEKVMESGLGPAPTTIHLSLLYVQSAPKHTSLYALYIMYSVTLYFMPYTLGSASQTCSPRYTAFTCTFHPRAAVL